MNWKMMTILAMLVLVGSTMACDKEDCETGLSVVEGVGTACTAVGAIACAATFGIGCAVAVGCGVAAGVSGAAKEACRACETDGGENGEFTDNDRNTLQEILDRNSFNDKDREKLQEILERAVEGFNNEDRITLQEILKLSKEGFNNDDRRIVQELLARAKFDSIKLGQIQTQMNDMASRINELGKKIDLAQIIGLYGDDLNDYYQVRSYYNHLQVTDGGRIKNDRHAEKFFKQAHDIIDIYYVSTNIYRMVTGGHILKPEGLFDAIPGSCNSIDYILAIMADCLIMYNTALAMKGLEILPAKNENFKNHVIEIQNQYIQHCGCPLGMFKKTRHNLMAMVEFEKANKPASQFYHEINTDPFMDKLTRHKMILVYSVKPFDNTEESKQIFTNIDIENALLVNTLGVEHLEDLHRYEGSLYCRKEYLMAIGGIDGAYQELRSVEVFPNYCDIPLPESRYAHISVTTVDGKILVCGGKIQSGITASCLQFNFKSKTWEHHSYMKSKYRQYSSAISLKHGVYILGGEYGRSSDFLATGSTEWSRGPRIPGRGVRHSCAVKLSDTEFVILGGAMDGTQAQVYSTTKKTWTQWPRLSNGVSRHSCVRLEDKIIMAGGSNTYGHQDTIRRTFIFDIKTGSAREVAQLKYPRNYADIVLYGKKPLILGGVDDWHRKRSDGELWNMDTETWEEVDIELNIGRSHFSLVTSEQIDSFPVTCKDGWQIFDERCYYFSGQKKAHTWNEAERECKNLHPLAHLVSITSKKEDNFISSNIGLSPFFIGANDKRIEGEWVWSDERPWGYTAWTSGEPNNWFNEDCVERGGWPKNSNLWNDVHCDTTYYGYRLVCSYTPS